MNKVPPNSVNMESNENKPCNIELIDRSEKGLSDSNSSISNSENKYYDIIILDCTLIQFIDETGVKCLNDLIKDYKKENVQFLLSNCNSKYLLINFFLNY